MDWATQPNPFRTYRGAPRIGLPLAADAVATPFPGLFVPGAVSPRPPSLDAVAALLELSLGISAWKGYGGERWALRCNPSSGNLHPTEGYVVLWDVDGIPAGVYHYASRDHALERRATFSGGAPFSPLPAGTFLVGLTDIAWREAWKYGERAFRYCRLDAGHAVAAVRYAAASLGWSARLVGGAGDAETSELLGLSREEDFDGAEREEPGALIRIGTSGGPLPPEAPGDRELLEAVRAAGVPSWAGRANALSPRHRHEWPVIGDVARAVRKPRTVETPWSPDPGEAMLSTCRLPAAAVIRSRRSAQAYDGETPIPPDDFLRILDATLPRRGVPPLDAIPWEPRMHLFLFVHRVTGFRPGLYAFVRRPGAERELSSATRKDFAWTRPEGLPEAFPLFLLLEGDARQAAETISCGQEIAADGAFSLGMVAEFDAPLALGPWWYPRLFVEAGAVGQVLYLEAEAAGFRGTGIGCFHDDSFHDLLGLRGTAYQSVYHFTVGTPVSDPRTETFPPYAHLTG
ncbi:MAG TPA: SagB/ThcOx family dehydrogenase [Candidatus Deferrimicrobiaceae bacterium]